MDVGVRDLKQHLSDYLDRAARGESIRVTDRGVPKVLIGPLLDLGQLDHGIEEGWVRPALRAGLTPTRRYRATRRSIDVLAEDRGE
jgi:prevent-host-death family protein